MSVKICKRCNNSLDISDFYIHKKMADGRLNFCKDCVKKRVEKHRTENLDKIKAYDKFRSNNPGRVKARKEYIKTEKGKAARSRASKKYTAKDPLKRAAVVLLNNSIKNGRIVKPSSCVKCGSSNRIQAHHYDYSRPLDVLWLCEVCHKSLHLIK